LVTPQHPLVQEAAEQSPVGAEHSVALVQLVVVQVPPPPVPLELVVLLLLDVGPLELLALEEVVVLPPAAYSKVPRMLVQELVRTVSKNSAAPARTAPLISHSSGPHLQTLQRRAVLPAHRKPHARAGAPPFRNCGLTPGRARL
jgi:hypothetical protein